MAHATGSCIDQHDALPATPPAGPTLLLRLADRFGEWVYRLQSRRVLASLDDRMLHDIGLTREDALGESDKPFWRS